MGANVLLESRPQVQSVVAGINYLKAASDRPYDYAYEPPNGEPWQNYESEARAMRITDARSLSSRPSLQGEGFELRDAPTAVVHAPSADRNPPGPAPAVQETPRRVDNSS